MIPVQTISQSPLKSSQCMKEVPFGPSRLARLNGRKIEGFTGPRATYELTPYLKEYVLE